MSSTAAAHRPGPAILGQRTTPVTHEEIAVTSPPPGPLLGVRAALIMLLAILAGLAAAGLTLLSTHSIPNAALTGGGTAAGALLLFNQVIGS